MEAIGKIQHILDPIAGTSGAGKEWKKQTIVIETNEQYPKSIALECWGKLVDELENLSVGQTIKCAINIESREYEKKWYTTAKAWKITGAVQPATQPATQTSDPINEDSNDLPF
jgi:hypothetical protein